MLSRCIFPALNVARNSYEVNVPRMSRNFPRFFHRFVRASERLREEAYLFDIRTVAAVARFINKRQAPCAHRHRFCALNRRSSPLFLRNKGCKIYSGFSTVIRVGYPRV